MIQVKIKKQSYFPVSTPKLKKKLVRFLKDEGIVSDAFISISFVGKVKMIELAKTYLKENNVIHNVLSFPAVNGKDEAPTGLRSRFFAKGDEFRYPPENPIQLGDIVICYPKVQEEANEEGKMVDDKIFELVKHGVMHLMGKHHE